MSHRDGWFQDSCRCRCGELLDPHIPVLTRPHVSCVGVNVALDTMRMAPAKCPRHRPSYRCTGSPVFYHYEPSAWQAWSHGVFSRHHRGGVLFAPTMCPCARELLLVASAFCSSLLSRQANCERSPAFVPEAFPKDHLRDIFSSWTTVGGSALRSQFALAPTTITVFVTRERYAWLEGCVAMALAAARRMMLIAFWDTCSRTEHANLFHVMTEMINVYQTLHMAGVVDARRPEDRSNMDDVSLVLLDSQGEVCVVARSLDGRASQSWRCHRAAPH